LEFGTHEEAENVHRSVALDSDGYLTTGIEGSAVVAEIHADSLNSLLHTLDDFLACTGVAERIVTKKA
jgi:tRNA threonylcarbamoyladenosine modification (KEOPS) complex  Pcc1 subunit